MKTRNIKWNEVSQSLQIIKDLGKDQSKSISADEESSMSISMQADKSIKNLQ